MSSRLSRALGTDVHQGYPTQRPQSIVWEMLSSSSKEMALHNLLIHATLGCDFVRVCFRSTKRSTCREPQKNSYIAPTNTAHPKVQNERTRIPKMSKYNPRLTFHASPADTKTVFP